MTHTLNLTDMELEAVTNALADTLERTRGKAQVEDSARLAAFRKAYAATANATIFVPTAPTTKWAARLQQDNGPEAA